MSNNRKKIAFTLVEVGRSSSLQTLVSESIPVEDSNSCEKTLAGQINIDRSKSTRQTGSHNSQARRFALSTKFGMTSRLWQSSKAAFTLAEVLITLGIIGIVAAMTLPTLIQKYKKHEVETRLKQSYSILGNIVNRAQADYGDIHGWDWSLDLDDFCDLYIMPYVQKTMHKDYNNKSTNPIVSSEYKLSLNNGTSWTLTRFYVPRTHYIYYIQVTVDINGNKKPNAQGKDQFNFYVFPEKMDIYNTGDGDAALNVPNAGVYYDGYGIIKKYGRNKIFNSIYRGCGGATYHDGEYCIALIVENNWKIPDDYPYKF